jgi:tRNA(fMet)-specific endonuclease VapC
LGLPVVVVEEYLRGRLSAVGQAKDGPARLLQYALLERSLRLIQTYPIAPFDQLAEDQYQLLAAMRLRIGTRDQKIAAIALANSTTLVTRNKKDFGQISGLVLEDWSV